MVDAIDALVTIDAASGSKPGRRKLSVEQGERLSGAFPLGDGQGAAKILDIQALLAEAFAGRARPDRSNAIRSVTATQAPEAGGGARDLRHFRRRRPGICSRSRPRSGDHRAARRASQRRRASTGAVAGMMALREQLLPLLSMRELLGFAPASASEARAKVIVASVGGALVGLIADRARAVISADPALIDPVPPVLQARSGGEARIKSIYRGEEGRRLVSILAPEQLFRGDVMKRLGEVRDAVAAANADEPGERGAEVPRVSARRRRVRLAGGSGGRSGAGAGSGHAGPQGAEIPGGRRSICAAPSSRWSISDSVSICRGSNRATGVGLSLFKPDATARA